MEAITLRDNIRRYQNGEEELLENIVAVLFPYLVADVQNRVAHLPERYREDAADEVMKVDWPSRLKAYNPDLSPPKAYLVAGVGKNLAKRIFKDFSKNPTSLESEIGTDDDRSNALDRIPDESGGPGSLGKPPATSDQQDFLLQLFFRVSGYPHQQIGFGYSILVYGREKQTGLVTSTRTDVWGDPAKVADEHAGDRLRDLFEGLIEFLHVHSGFPQDLIAVSRMYFDRRLDMTVGELFQRDASSAKVFQDLLSRLTGTTLLQEWFGSRGGKASIADWCDKIKARTFRALNDPDSLKRSPIPFSRPGEEISEEER